MKRRQQHKLQTIQGDRGGIPAKEMRDFPKKLKAKEEKAGGREKKTSGEPFYTKT